MSAPSPQGFTVDPAYTPEPRYDIDPDARLAVARYIGSVARGQHPESIAEHGPHVFTESLERDECLSHADAIIELIVPRGNRLRNLGTTEQWAGEHPGH